MVKPQLDKVVKNIARNYSSNSCTGFKNTIMSRTTVARRYRWRNAAYFVRAVLCRFTYRF